MKRVIPKYFNGLNIPIWNNIFGIKLIYICGNCRCIQSKRVNIHSPLAICKWCKARYIL